jgi:hypothetical protein
MNKTESGNKRQKAWLAKHLRMGEDLHRFEVLWEELDDRGIVEDWELDRTTDEDVLEDARNLLDRFRAWEGRSTSSVQKPEGRAMEDIPVEPTERETYMTEALRYYLASHADRRPIVQKFRREDLPDGRLLTEDEEISDFLDAELGFEWGVQNYLEDRIEDSLEDGRGKPGSAVPLILDSKPPHRDTCGVYTYEELAGMRAEAEIWEARLIEENWDGPPGYRLQKLGEWLVDKYPWESVGEAEVFLISGRPPRLAEPLRASHDGGSATYSITFPPWVSEDTIVRAYRTIQTLHRQPPGDKTLRVLRFVSEQANDEGVLPSWATLYELWNAAYPDERFSSRSALFKAYRRAVEALVPPYLPLT